MQLLRSGLTCSGTGWPRQVQYFGGQPGGETLHPVHLCDAEEPRVLGSLRAIAGDKA